MREPEHTEHIPRQDVRVPIAEERVAVETRPHVIGEVLLRRTVTEESQTVALDVAREVVRVTRRNVAPRPAAPAEIERAFAAATRRIPVLGERAGVAKRPFVTGEVVVHRRPVVEHKTVTESVRHVVVEPEVIPQAVPRVVSEVVPTAADRAEVLAPQTSTREVVPAPAEKLGAVWREVKDGFTRGRTRS